MVERVHDVGFTDEGGFIAGEDVVIAVGDENFGAFGGFAPDETCDEAAGQVEGMDGSATFVPMVWDLDGAHEDGTVGEVFEGDVPCVDEEFKEVLGGEEFSADEMVDVEETGEIEARTFEIVARFDEADGFGKTDVFCERAGDEIGFIIARGSDENVGVDFL